VVQVVPNWWYRNCTGGGPEHDIAFRVVPKWTGTETDHPVVPKWFGTERDLPLHILVYEWVVRVDYELGLTGVIGKARRNGLLITKYTM